MINNAPIFTFTAKTDIWTGDADRQSDFLKHTGLLGSIRWWFEIVVRGLGGYACDPSETKCKDKTPCVVCELFGCTGWSRKFRFDVLDERDAHIQEQIKADDVFKLKFTPLRPIQEEEWALLSLTLKLIARYGAIGGKTVLKPSDEKGREEERHHVDYGLVTLEEPTTQISLDLEKMKEYVQLKGKDKKPIWASLENFWCVERYLKRETCKKSSFNKVVGRNEDKSEKKREGKKIIRYSDFLSKKNDKISEWLAGNKQKSKKVFSFKNLPRTFGFVEPSLIDHNAMKERLKSVWSDLKDEEYLHGVERFLEVLSKKNNT